MQKNAHVAVCSLRTNPEGAELRLTYGKVQLTEVSHHLFALPIVALAWRERYQSRNGGSRHDRSAPRQPNGNGNQVVLDGLAEPKTDYSNEDLVGLSSIRD